MAAPVLPLVVAPDGNPCLTVIVLDAGQGDCTLVVFPDGRLMMIDCGSNKNSRIVSSQIFAAVRPYLTATNSVIDTLVLTHPNTDHYNLLMKLINQLGATFTRVVYGGEARQYCSIARWLTRQAPALADPHFSMALDQASYAGGPTTPPVEVRILAANAADRTDKDAANDNSVVVLLTIADVNIFIMGDATDVTELFILRRDANTGGALAAHLQNHQTVIRVGHHGSQTSSSPQWLAALQPVVAFISSDTKEWSGVGLPREAVVQQYLQGPLAAPFPAHYVLPFVDRTGHVGSSITTALFTTLHLRNPLRGPTYTAYGTSWYYTVSAQRSQQQWVRANVYITPSCGWAAVNTPY